jgi:hypothetical protein
MSLYTFDPNQTTVTWGPYIITGFAESPMLTVVLDKPRWNTEDDVHGNSIRYGVKSTTATITLTLTQGSPSNDTLTLVSKLDNQFGTGALPFTIKDNSGTSEFKTLRAYVENTPSATFANTTGNNREWTLKAVGVDYNFGGLNVT